MKYKRDTKWPDKLQAAVFAENNQFKRSTSYTPFQLTFGSSDSFGLLKLLKGATVYSIVNNDYSCDAELRRRNSWGYPLQKCCVLSTA